MAERTEPLRSATASHSEALPALWWLWLPLAGALALVFLARLVPATYHGWIAGERGLLEFLHVVMPAASLVLAFALMVRREAGSYRLLRLWLGLAVLGSLYVAGEEASWGQHVLQWTTPEYWQALNDQGETNLHNTSSWLDQKPRLLLELGVVVGGILIPLAALRWPRIWRSRLAIILPPTICLPSALLAEFARLSEDVPGAWGGATVVFQRPSEVQETYFYVFILLYLVVLRRRLLARPR